MKMSTALLIISTFMACFVATANAGGNFYAYYTKVQHSATDYLGKYTDLIVVLGEGKQLEFTRQTGYQPLWRTNDETFLLDDFYQGRDKDFEFYYNYVRLMESTPEKIVVHWRYIPDIQSIKRSIREKNPLTPYGFLGVVHELFTIYPDGKVERYIKDAANSTAEDWVNPNLAVTQSLQLKNNGVEYGPVDWGRGEPEIDDEAELSEEDIEESIVDMDGLTEPIRNWRLDEGLYEHESLVIEEISEEESMIEGINISFKDGVSGSALVLDGYYSGFELNYNNPEFKDEMSLEAWVALDVYPYNDAPIVHRSKNFGEEGYYFGLNPYGHLFFRINGIEITSDAKVPLYKWQHLAVTVGEGKITLYQNSIETVSLDYNGEIEELDVVTKIGINTEKTSCSDYVRTPQQNLPFILGIQGIIDEVKMYDKVLTINEITESYDRFLPNDLTSPISKGVLPGEIGVAEEFGAYYKNLKFQELWDNMWRTIDDDVIVKFDNMPTSVIYWRGSNYAANWITDKNQWMSDQSSEIWGTHGCSEHMADKQVRHSYARIIENTPARVVVHWRYPCVDVGYICDSKLNWSDEYHTIYPDGTGIRKVHWNKIYDKPGFQDIQFFTNPDETALDVVDLQAMTVANAKGDVEELMWAKPNKVPEITIDDATIELLNSKSDYRIFVIFQGGHITPWGSVEQSAYTEDPFAGPWNHWPMHFVPSDGRFAIDHDRVTHFALAANDWAPEFGSLVHYGFTQQSIETVIPLAKYWQNPPELMEVKGCKNEGFDKDQKAFVIDMRADDISFTIDAVETSPVVNPVILIKNWLTDDDALVKINGKEIKSGSKFREGTTRNETGKITKIIWLELTSDEQVSFEISKKE
jgi:hypothetical protein